MRFPGGNTRTRADRAGQLSNCRSGHRADDSRMPRSARANVAKTVRPIRRSRPRRRMVAIDAWLRFRSAAGRAPASAGSGLCVRYRRFDESTCCRLLASPISPDPSTRSTCSSLPTIRRWRSTTSNRSFHSIPPVEVLRRPWSRVHSPQIDGPASRRRFDLMPTRSGRGGARTFSR
jgi:hypothetical protein